MAVLEKIIMTCFGFYFFKITDCAFVSLPANAQRRNARAGRLVALFKLIQKLVNHKCFL